MLLVADIGNTSTTFGVYDNETLVDSWRVASDKKKSEDEYGIILDNLIVHKGFKEKLTGAIISSVVLPLTESFKVAIEKYLGVPVIVLSHKINSGIIIDTEKPKEVGADRIANACAAYKLYKTNCVVVDFGTATTFDIVSEDGRFFGGVIAPGIKISAEALSAFTSLLPKVRLEATKSVIGRNTIDAMLAGLVNGHAAMVEGIIASIEEELKTPVVTIATGGYSKIMLDCMKKPFDYLHPHLTLEGLRIIYNLQQQ